MDDPCRWCNDYPYWCRGRCRDKTKYLNEVSEDTPIVTKKKRTRIVDINKNGIRREITYERRYKSEA